MSGFSINSIYFLGRSVVVSVLNLGPDGPTCQCVDSGLNVKDVSYSLYNEDDLGTKGILKKKFNL